MCMLGTFSGGNCVGTACSLLLLSTGLCSTLLFFASNLLLCYCSNSGMAGKWLSYLLENTQTATQHLLCLQFHYWEAEGFTFFF